MPMLFCTDEDLAIETPDYRTLCPPDSYDAYGNDGLITALDPWVLRSALVDFRRNNVQPGAIIWLSQPEEVFGGEPGEGFAVDSVLIDDGHALQLRRRGRELGQGDPPGDGLADIPAIHFEILTLAPLIAKASQEIEEQLDIPGLLASRPGQELDPADLRILTDLAVAKVLERRYLAVSRGTEIPGAKEIFLQKSDAYKARIEEISARMLLRFSTGEPVRRRRTWSRII